jgi:hypothetical protein
MDTAADAKACGHHCGVSDAPEAAIHVFFAKAVARFLQRQSSRTLAGHVTHVSLRVHISPVRLRVHHKTYYASRHSRLHQEVGLWVPGWSCHARR